MRIKAAKREFNRSLLKIVFVLGLVLTSAFSVNAAFGDPDPTFGSLGSGKVNDIFLVYEARSIALQPDGKILVAGVNVGRVQLSRYLP